MLEKKKLFVHGGSSLISKYLIEKFSVEFDEIHIFCRNKSKAESIINIDNFKSLSFFFL